MNDNRIVQGLWSHGRLSVLAQLCIRSFCAHGHEFHLYAYQSLPNVPQVDGVRVLPGEDILPRAAMFTGKGGAHVHFADLFRWELLRQKGGWWTDMDMVCLRPLDFSADVVFASEGIGNSAAPSIMKFPAGHFFAARMADACANVNRIVPWDTGRRKRNKIIRRLMFWRDAKKTAKWGEAGGPAGMSLAVNHFEMQKHAVPVHVFYPVHFSMAEYLFNGEYAAMNALEPLLSRSYAVHFWNQILRQNGMDVNGSFPKDSLYEILKRRYGEAEE